MHTIPFSLPTLTGDEERCIREAIGNRRFSGDGPFTKEDCRLLRDRYGFKNVLLTSSCTHALEMAALLIDIKPGEEVIMPSYTFTSTANAFVLRGARIVFVDVRPDTMNIDENVIEAAITERTRAICVVHYAGVGCAMEEICATARKHNLYVIEDAAQAIHAQYRGGWLGTQGDLSAFSFHETKNIQCGEGGALVINNPAFMDRAEFIREKGTNRSQFWRGQTDKYTWIDLGSSYLLSELNAAFLCPQLRQTPEITADRLRAWQSYYDALQPLAQAGLVELPTVPAECTHNGHIFHIRLKDRETRDRLLGYLDGRKVNAVFHYIPLHSAAAGRKYGSFHGEDTWTTRESGRLLRLPLYYTLSDDHIQTVVREVTSFFDHEKK